MVKGIRTSVSESKEKSMTLGIFNLRSFMHVMKPEDVINDLQHSDRSPPVA